MAAPKWRVCPCNARYQVSDHGRVRNKRTRRQCKQWDNGRGYMRVRLCHKQATGRWYAVHLLVLVTFDTPRPSPEYEGAHHDGNRLNNKIGNLFWKTKEQNTADRIKHCAERKNNKC